MKRAKRVWNIISLSALMAFLAACHKDPTPQPNPDHPTDTITPIVPTKDVTIVWDWSAGVGRAPPKDTVKYYTDQDSVRLVDIYLIGENGIGYPINCTGSYANVLHRARDSLQTRIDIDSTKVKLSGTLIVGEILPNHNSGQEPGIAWYDSVWFVKQGCVVRRPAH